MGRERLPAPKRPPKKLLRKVMRAEEMRAVILAEIQRCVSEFAEAGSKPWPRGWLNPPPRKDADSIEALQNRYVANRTEAEAELPQWETFYLDWIDPETGDFIDHGDSI